MEQIQIIPHLQNIFGEDHIQDCPETRDTCVLVPVDKLFEVMKTLRDEPDLRMDFLNSVTGVDLLDLPGIETPVLRSIYHLYSYRHRHDLMVMVDVERGDPLVPSMAPLWDSAVWLEREAFDLVGLIYEGHPNLTRILLPAEFEGHPLRRDWVESEFVMGIETQRETPVDLLKFFHDAMGGEAPPELSPPAPREIAPEQKTPPAPLDPVEASPPEQEAAPTPEEGAGPGPAASSSEGVEGNAKDQEPKPTEDGGI